MSTYNSSDIPVLQVQLDTVQQEITYNGMSKTIPDSLWKDEIAPFLYPLWDSDKDKLIMFSWFTNETYYAKRRRFKKNFKTGEYEWVDYEMEQLGAAEGLALKNKLVESYYLIDSIENTEFQLELTRMYQKQKEVSPFSLRLARNFLLSETDWALASDSPLGAEDRELYTVYRQKLRELTEQTEFSVDPESTKFPISPDFYKKVYSVDYPGEGYLTTATQYLPIGKHYLKLFREKIANYLVLKSLTESNYFSRLLLEYDKVQNDSQVQEAPTELELTDEQRAERKEWLEDFIKNLESQMDDGAGA